MSASVPHLVPTIFRRTRAALFRTGLALASLASWPSRGAAAEAIVESPFAPRSGPRGSTMFTLLAPETTGIRTENRYADPQMWGKRYHEFEVGPIGTGVAIGDYDGDGRPDLFVVSKTESCRLFRNLGSWKFEDVSTQAGVADIGAHSAIWKQGAAFADVNNDGRLDLYVCRFDAPNLLYVNQGDGTFREQAEAAGLAVRDASLMAAFADYDRDGWLDVYVQTNLLDNAANPTGQPDHLFRNRGDATFENVTARAGIANTRTQGNAAIWWDYNGDGWPDLYVANDFATPDFLYRNNGDGTFANVVDRVVPHTPYSAMGADAADVNNDGLVDLFVADMAATTHEKDQRTMADNRAKAIEPPDGSTAAPNYVRNALYVNTGTGRCLEAAFLAGLAATDWTWSTRFEDFDNDGRVDLHVTNGMHREVHNVDLLQRVMLTESPAERVRLVRASPVLAEANLVYRNRGDLAFENVSGAWGLDQRGVSFGSATGDLDGDGDLDLVFTNYEAGVSVLRNDSDEGHRILIDLRGVASNRYGAGATVTLESASGTQVREVVLARGYLSSSEPIVHFGLGPDPAIHALTVRWPRGSVQRFENLTADRRYTITEPPLDSANLMTRAPPNDTPAAPTLFQEVSASLGLNVVALDAPVDEIAKQRLLPTRLHRRGPAIAVGDLDGHEPDDVVIGGTARTPARVLLAKDDRAFSALELPRSAADSPVTDGPVLVFDADGDNRNDLLITKGGAALPAGLPAYQPELRLNTGSGGLRPTAANALPAMANSAGAVASADFNRDGKLDIFVGGRVRPTLYPATPRSVLLVNQGGTFADVTEALASGLREIGMVTAALWTDVDLDDWPDLLLALEWGRITCLHNQQGRGFEDWTERVGFAAAGTGWWTSLAAADFNGDGRQDYAAGNVGLNTQYHATPERPALLFVGNFKEGGGPPQLIEAHYASEGLVPWRTRRTLGAAIPSILKRFPTNDGFAAASLEEIFGEEKLRAAKRYAATELRSGVFLSQPDGTYVFSPAPRIAQIAPWQGIVAEDFDGDGRADLCVAQNSFAPAPLVGRFDGGLSQLLRGDGHGSFTAVPARESGLVVPGDAKGVAVLDLANDGWPDVIVTRHHQPTLAFQNRGLSGRQSTRIILRGPAGNPTAVGARLTATWSTGRRRTWEFCAGSGYASQSSAAAFIGSGADDTIQTITARWSDGTQETHTWPASPSRTLTFSYPVR